MFRCLRAPTTALLLSALLVPTVHAGAAPQLNSSEASVIVTSFVVLSLPMAASMGPVRTVQGAVQGQRTQCQGDPHQGGAAAADGSEEGGDHAHGRTPGAVAGTDKADHTATLRWPVQPQGENPTAAFVVGQRVHFDPTEGRCRLEREERAGPDPGLCADGLCAGDVMSEAL